MINISPYLSFDGNCEEALNFYQSCFGGDTFLMRFQDGPMKDQFPESQQSLIMHGEMKNENFTIMATDMQGPAGHQPGNDMSNILTFDDESLLRKCFALLSAGGTVLEPVGQQFWGDIFGELRDKYGKKWKMLLPLNQPNS
ncbi:VOC family protein [Echinicola sp. CAU 1574]|uniref:VOC family protein n=1 Tax=Echinicola arenosa TaxID=2774144 RepID=A0ABR9AIT3_9BACT|nr:VOC family protein [Echinicola arenosa]MBD8488641.1 VOC family protein [Echinicola arenosa]